MSRLFNPVTRFNLRQTWPYAVVVVGVLGWLGWTRLADLGGYVIVDEADRWRWAEAFYRAIIAGNLRATLVGDGYPGIVPVWLETIWLLAESARQSLLAGHWFGEAGVYMLFHVWSRPAYLLQQRLPIVLFNTCLALLVSGYAAKIFGRWVGLTALILIALDPFYLSDSRVNRAEAMITGLMTLSVLFLILYDRQRRFRYVILSGILGGLSLLTKIQALVLLPIVGLIIMVICWGASNAKTQMSHRYPPRLPISFSLLLNLGLVWLLAAGLTWFILWPAMWVAPVDTLTLVYNYATRKVDAEGVNLFFWGQTYQNTDPGPFFYLVVFLLRITPSVFLGLVGFVSGMVSRIRLRIRLRIRSETSESDFFTLKGGLILVIYVLAYAVLMTIGSHKQDRYLLPIFLGVDILAALGLVYLGGWLKNKLSLLSPLFTSYFLLPISYFLLLIIQLFTVLPHHPYYYSYFNPLLGSGQTAVRLLRVGWGEGMDQVGAYLAAKPNSQQLVVSSRFTHNMLGFKGKLMSLNPDGRWPQADYIVLYIQQVQRELDPSPGFIHYFQARPAEKVITIGGIDYAWIYPRPFTVPANPLVSVIPGQAALLGYRWENTPTTRLRVVWENQGLSAERPLAARLVGPTTATDWRLCLPDPNFVTQARAPGEFVESLCQFNLTSLAPDIYTVEFGLLGSPVEVFAFHQGRYAARITAGGRVEDTPAAERLDIIVQQTIPAATRLDRVYDGWLRLAAYHLDPPTPKPGEAITLTLYWQPVAEIPFIEDANTEDSSVAKNAAKPLRVLTQLADSRSLSLGRVESEVDITDWQVGEIMVTRHHFNLAANLDAPLAAQVEVSLLNDDKPVRVTTLTGKPLPAAITRLTVAPTVWPDLQTEAGFRPVTATWAQRINLKGYVSPSEIQPGATYEVSLYWIASQPLTEDYMIFVHVLDTTGQIKAQHDSLPRAGAYPTSWWSPGQVIKDVHTLVLPPDLPAGSYQLMVGLYRQGDGSRLPLQDKTDSFQLAKVEAR